MRPGFFTDLNETLALMPSGGGSIAHATLTDNVIDRNNLLPNEFGSCSKFGLLAAMDLEIAIKRSSLVLITINHYLDFTARVID